MRAVSCGKAQTCRLDKGDSYGTKRKADTESPSLAKKHDQGRKQLPKLFLCRYKPRFHRQYVIGNYIADFYCHKAKLVVELDGSQHCTPEEMHYDQKRTEYLQSQGLKVLRLSNLDVMRRFESVCQAVDMAVKQSAADF